MSDWYIREIQELEYMECLRTDLEREIVEYEKKTEEMELKRVVIENMIIEEAEQLDYELERCKLSPRSLRLKRLEFYENKIENVSKNVYETNDDRVLNNSKSCESKVVETLVETTIETTLQVEQCISITKKGKRCLKRPVLGLDVCCIHKKLK
tara:strand:+ start:4693 stop:5151 length:459 start_codon:yes stop_codon:yes gene_type:complete